MCAVFDEILQPLPPYEDWEDEVECLPYDWGWCVGHSLPEDSIPAPFKVCGPVSVFATLSCDLNFMISGL